MTKEPEEDFRTVMHKAVSERLEYIAKNKEALLEAWIAQHGYKPDECILVQRDEGMTTKFWIERKSQKQIESENRVYICEWLIKDPTTGNGLLPRSEEFDNEAQAYAKASSVIRAAKESGYEAHTDINWRYRK